MMAKTLELFSTTWVTGTSNTLFAIPNLPLNASVTSGRTEVRRLPRKSGRRPGQMHHNSEELGGFFLNTGFFPLE
jgi:hypothetical protein